MSNPAPQVTEATADAPAPVNTAGCPGCNPGMEAPEGGVAGACRKCGHTTECDMHHQKECEKPRMKNVYGPISGLWAWYRYSKDKRAYQAKKKARAASRTPAHD